jgi:putative transposase
MGPGDPLKYDPLKHHRRSVRLAGFDYAAPGAYFVTIVVRGRECLLGEVTPDGATRLSEMGQAAHAEWEALPRHFPQARLDAFILMPNHLHGIIMVDHGMANEGRGEASASNRAATTNPPVADASPLRAHGTRRGSLGAMVQSFKSVSTRRLNVIRGTPGAPFWQRNYWEHVVRGGEDLDRIRMYMQANPAQWAADALNPTAALV